MLRTVSDLRYIKQGKQRRWWSDGGGPTRANPKTLNSIALFCCTHNDDLILVRNRMSNGIAVLLPS